MPVQANRFPCPAAHPIACRGPAVPPSRRRRGSARSLPENIRQERLAAFRHLASVEESRKFGGQLVLKFLQLLASRQHPGAEQDQPARPFAPGLFRPFRASARGHDNPMPRIPEEPLRGFLADARCRAVFKRCLERSDKAARVHPGTGTAGRCVQSAP